VEKLKTQFMKSAIIFFAMSISYPVAAQSSSSSDAERVNTDGIRCMGAAVSRLDDGVTDATNIAQVAIGQCQSYRDRYLVLLAQAFGPRINLQVQRQNLYNIDMQNVTRFVLERRAQRR
jgi:hypothetical protein